MTYLELVNNVLARMREPEVLTLQGATDEVVILAKSFVNDAKRKVEDSWRWNCLKYDWSVATADGTALYSLTDSGNYGTIDSVHNVTDQYVIPNAPLNIIREKQLVSSGTDEHISYWAVDGQDANQDMQIRVWPTPNSVKNLTVYGWKRQADLSADNDVLCVPATPVIYEALAYAVRERGEVGGTTAAEVFLMADRFMRDAIALDAGSNFEDTIWVAV